MVISVFWHPVCRNGNFRRRWMLANILNLLIPLGNQSPSELPLAKVSPCYFPISIGRSLLEAFMPQDNTTSKALTSGPFLVLMLFRMWSCPAYKWSRSLSSLAYNSQSTKVLGWGFALIKSTFKVKTRLSLAIYVMLNFVWITHLRLTLTFTAMCLLLTLSNCHVKCCLDLLTFLSMLQVNSL